MGAWGSGNFENDAALDQVGDFVSELKDDIDNFAEADDSVVEDTDAIMANVSMMLAVCRDAGTGGPKPDEILRWRDRMLAIYDEQIDGLSPGEEYKTERRGVIVKTFDDLHNLSLQFWKK